MVSQKEFATLHTLHLSDIHGVANGSLRPNHTTPNSIRSVLEGIWKFCRPDLTNLETFLQHLMRDYEIEIKSVMLNDLSHGGKVADPLHDSEDVKLAAIDAIAVVEKFAEGQVKNL